jgi:hypothetical protein
MGDWLFRLGTEGQLATWLVASCLLYMLSAQLAWQYRFPGRTDFLGQWIDDWRDHVLAPWAGEVTRFIYYLGIPVAVAMLGLLRADLLGINGAQWVPDQSAQGFLWKDWLRGIGLAVGAVAVVAAVWTIGRAASTRAGLSALRPRGARPLWQQWLETLYCQAHWAFYRTGPILWLNDPYWGTFAGLVLVLFEMGLDPAFWWALKSTETAAPVLFRVGAAWVSALIFVETHNLWLTGATHLVMVTLLRPQHSQDAWQV